MTNMSLPNHHRHRRGAERLPAGSRRERRPRTRGLLTGARPAPVADALAEHHLQPRLLIGAELRAAVVLVREVQRLQLALVDVLCARAAGHLTRRRLLLHRAPLVLEAEVRLGIGIARAD